MRRGWVFVLAALTLLASAGGWWRFGRVPTPPVAASLSVVEAVNSSGAGFKRVTEPRSFEFPADHGPHAGYQTEWWYYTGNLDTADGRHFGYQLTFFQRALAPEQVERPSNWGTSALYMAHFAVTDVAGEQFYAFDRFSRNGAQLAGAQADPFRVYLENWSASGSGEDTHLLASQGPVSLDLQVRGTKPPALQGDRGLSQKGAETGNASYYYSLTRMATTGTVTINGQNFTVSGTSWMDREWSTSVLGPEAVGWDWFALQLADGREIMFYQIRRRDGSSDPFSSGSLIATDGTVQRLKRDDVELEVLDRWRSPRSTATYPAHWRMRIPAANLDLEIKPYLADQELALAVTYWEGASRIRGTSNGQPISGNGYVELTGYGDEGAASVQGRR